MNYLERAAVLTELIERLRTRDGWAGATHIQKSAYLLQEMLGVPLGLRFRLYKFGPFSGMLRDELDEMELDEFIAVEPQRPPYGPRLRAGEANRALQARYADEVRHYDKQLGYIVDVLAPLGVGDLEKLSTAFYVTREVDSGDVAARAARLHELKPHVSLSEADEAVRKIDSVLTAGPHL